MKFKKLILCVAISQLAYESAKGQNTYTFIGANGASWIRSSNWSGGATGKSPGVDANTSTTVDGATNDIAAFSTSATILSVGINFNTGSGNGSSANGAANQSLTLGALTLATGGASGNFLIGNNSTTLNGTLTLTGTTVGGNSNVILQNTSANSLTLANIQGSGNKLMDIALGNTTNNVVRITSTGGITISSVVKGSNNLTLEGGGTGTLTLSGTNTYSGTTSVNSGKLVVTDTIGSSAVTVSNSGTILATDAAATIGSTISIENGAILAAGDAATAGTATVLGASTFNDGSIFSWDINAAGTSYDKLITTSMVDGNAAGGSVFRIVAADATFANSFWSSNQSWTNIFTTDGTAAISGWASIFTSVSVVNSTFGTITPTAGSFSVSGNTLTWTAVPEPTSALVGLLITAGLLRRRRAA